MFLCSSFFYLPTYIGFQIPTRLNTRLILTLLALSFITLLLPGQDVARKIVSCEQLEEVLDSCNILSKQKSAELIDYITKLDSTVYCKDYEKVYNFQKHRYKALQRELTADENASYLLVLLQKADVYDREYSFKYRVNLLTHYKKMGKAVKINDVLSNIRTMVSLPEDSLYLAYSLFNTGNFYSGRREFNNSTPLYKEAIEVSQRHKITNIESLCYSQLAFGFRQVEDLENALRYGRKALALESEKISPNNRFFMYTNMAHWNRDIGELDSAFYYLQGAKAINPNHFNIHFETGSLYLEMNKPDSALIAFNRLEGLMSKKMDAKDNVIASQAIAYSQLGNKRRALKLFRQAMDTSDLYSPLDYENRLSYVLGYMENYFELNDKSQLSFVEDIKTNSDSLRQVDIRNQISQAEIKYESLYKEKENVYLRNSNKDKLARLTLQKRFLISSLIALAVLIIMMWLVIKRNREISNLNKQVNYSNKMLFLQNKEMGHRHKGYLNMAINLLMDQRAMSTESHVSSELFNSEKRLRALTTVNNLIDTPGKKIDDLINMIAEDLTYSAGQEIDLTVEIDELNLDENQMTSLALITNELIINSLKYAFNNIDSPSIKIFLNEKMDGYAYTYRDNGVGLDGTIKGTGVGMQLISDLVHQLKGRVSSDSLNGYCTSISFPKQIAYV